MTSRGNVSQRIRAFNERLLADKVQLKYELMAGDPFRFYRGTCHLFYEDLSRVSLPRSPHVWMCGDLHLENFGTFKGDNRLVYFDVNDFDESVLGPASWDLARIVTSIFVAFDSLKIEEKKAVKWAELFLKTYSETLSRGKARYIETETANGIVRSFLEQVCQRTEAQLLQKRIEIQDKKIVFRIDNKKHFKLKKELKKELAAHINDWILYNEDDLDDFEVKDVCFRVAGTGSLGVRRYVFLLQNRKDKKHYMLLDMKQAMPSSLMPFIKVEQPAWESEALRIVAAKFNLQNISPALLSTTVFRNNSYVLQEMQPTEDRIDFRLIKNRYRDVCEVMKDMALLTASAQLRSSGRQGSAIADELTGFGKTNIWQSQVLQYSREYALQVKKDYQGYLADFQNDYFTMLAPSIS